MAFRRLPLFVPVPDHLLESPTAAGRIDVDGELAGSGGGGRCTHCDRWCGGRMPDACLGYIPGVAHACCGHGEPFFAYVAFGDYPDQDMTTARVDQQEASRFAQEAVDWFHGQGLGPDHA